MNESFPAFATAPTLRIIVTHDPTPTPEGAATLRALQQAVAQALDRKHRLGQYAVVWQNGRVEEVVPGASSLAP